MEADAPLGRMRSRGESSCCLILEGFSLFTMMGESDFPFFELSANEFVLK
jgi:hypothetical protein